MNATSAQYTTDASYLKAAFICLRLSLNDDSDGKRQERINAAHDAENRIAVKLATPDLADVLKQSNEALMDLHKHARGMWNELLASGFADADLKMPCHNQTLDAVDSARAALAKLNA